MNPRKKFSVRQNIKPEPSPALDDAPEGLRYFLLKYLQKRYHDTPWHAGEILADFLHRPELQSGFFNPHDPAVWGRLYRYIKGFEWWEVYDFIEAVHEGDGDYYHRQQFRVDLNKVLAEGNIGYQMNNGGEVVYRGSESFETVVNTAKSVLAATGKNTAMNEIHKALEDLSKRPVSDLTGAVQHAIAALECVAKDVCGEKGETLGQVVKKHPERFPPPVGEAVSKLYGFASEKGRHIAEGGEPDPKEVELIVGIAATVATYLSR